jgi:hypothetical protein
MASLAVAVAAVAAFAVDLLLDLLIVCFYCV